MSLCFGKNVEPAEQYNHLRGAAFVRGRKRVDELNVSAHILCALHMMYTFYRHGSESRLPATPFYAITVLFQSPIVRAIALEPVHVYAAYVAQLVEMRAVVVSPAGDAYFEHAPAGHRFHREQILDTAGLPVNPTRGRPCLAQGQFRAHITRVDGRPVLDQQPV